MRERPQETVGENVSLLKQKFYTPIPARTQHDALARRTHSACVVSCMT